MEYKGTNGEYFGVNTITKENDYIIRSSKQSELSLLWFISDNNQLVIDSVTYNFNQNEIICLTEFHKVEVVNIQKIKLLRFNRPFYCILDHDSEIGCKGILFFGATNLPVINPDDSDIDILETVWKMICIEMVSKDNLQLEMLQTMLKRLLILCTRIYKNQLNYNILEGGNNDTIREFNFLVEKHFREKHKVNEYAKLLSKTPKSLSNLFRKVNSKTPLQFIQERVALEARRLLKYTDKSISEIGYEIGFTDVQSFSRFFKNKENRYPTEYRNLDVKEVLPTKEELPPT